MISKEKIEKATKRLNEILSCYDEYKKDCEEGHRDSFELDIEDFETLKTMLNYIQQLETKEQKVMKFLIECKKEYTEELKYNFTKRDARLQLQLVDIILKIMKGEE